MCGKSSKPATTVQNVNQSGTATTAPNPLAMQSYQDLLARANTVASQPFQPYTGELVAPVNAQQTAGIAGVNAAANQAQPYIQGALPYVSGAGSNIAGATSAADAAMSAGQPITSADINAYLDPYTGQVVSAAEREFANMNAVQQQGVLGNAAAQGALGGDRVAVAQANLAHQQALAEDPVIANLLSQGYQRATQTALAEQGAGMQAAGLSGNLNLGAANAGLGTAYTLANLGVAGQGAALQGAGAQIQAGTLQQQTQQAQDQAQLAQYYAAQGFPYQQAAWLAGIDLGVGSQMGGTTTQNSSGTQTTAAPPPSFLGQAIGGGLTAAALLANRGGRVPGFAPGGGVEDGGFSGMPYGNVRTYVPGVGALNPRPMQLAAPPTVQFSSPKPSGAGDMFKNAVQLAGVAGKAFKGGFGEQGANNLATDTPDNMSEIYTGPAWQPGFPSMGNFGYRRGGFVPTIAGFGTGGIILPRRYADGGDTFDDRFPEAGDIDAGSFVNNPSGIEALRDYGSGNITFPPPPVGVAPANNEVPLPRARPVLDNGPTEIARNIPWGVRDSQPETAGVAPLAFDATDDVSGPATTSLVGSEPTAGVGAPARNILGLPGLSDSARQALLAAGLGMMASRSPYPLQALGEGGLHGLAAYQQNRAFELRGKTEADRIAMQTRRLDEMAKQAAERLKVMTAGHTETERHNRVVEGETERSRKAAEAERERQHNLMLKTPVKYGEDRRGPLYALPKPGPNGVELWPIDPKTGQLGTSPLGGGLGSNLRQPQPQSSAEPGFRTAAMTEEKAIAAAPPQEIRAQQPFASKQARNDAYLKYVADDIGGADGAKYAATIKGIADYKMNPAMLFSLRGNRRENAMGDVMMYDPTYDQRRYAQTNRAISGWAQSPEGRSTRALSVVIEHLGTADHLGRALQNGDVQAINALKNTIKEQFGYAAPATFDFAKQIVADEIAKAVIGGQNAEGDRQALQQRLSRASSPEQLSEIIHTAKELMSGQLIGLKHTYEWATGLNNFDSQMTDRAQAEMATLLAERERQLGQSNMNPDQAKAALDWLRKNPNDPRAGEVRKRLGIQ